MTDRLAATVSWIEQHPGLAAWMQALGATLAVVVAVLVPALQARHARQQRDADRRLRAKSLAIAIYPELLHIRIVYRLICQRLRAQMQQRPSPLMAAAELARETKGLLVPVSADLRSMVPNFYLLGEPLGPQVQQCIGRSVKYNDILTALKDTGARVDLPQLLRFVEGGLAQAETCIAGIEQAWNVSADEANEFEDHVTGHHEPLAATERETASKETV